MKAIGFIVKDFRESWKLQEKLLNKGFRWSERFAIEPSLPVGIPIGDYGTLIYTLCSGSKLLTYLELNTIDDFKYFTKKIKLINKSKLKI